MAMPVAILPLLLVVLSALLAVPSAAQTASVKTVFEKYNLLGTFAWDCSKPASRTNYYYVHRALDGGHVQRDLMSAPTTRDWVATLDKAAERASGEIAVSGTRDGQPFDSIYRVEARRMRVMEGTVAGKKEISGGRFANSGKEMPWLNKCDVKPALAAAPVSPSVEKAEQKVTVVSGRRVALVIGNGNYQFATKLGNPANDASDIANALRKLGFDVVEGRDLDKRGVEDKLREFSRKLAGAKLALFFYAGHGMQVAGKNYLVPVDAKLEQPGDLRLDTIDIADVLSQMEAEPRVNLVFLDACRDNPLARSFARSMGARSASVGQGLALVQSAIGTMIAYATQPDAVALDGDGRNSPFTKALLKHIATPAVDISTVMRRVRADVIAETSERQVPWDHSSLVGDVVLTR
jgi:Caspase domain